MNSIKQTKKAIFPVRVEVGAMGEEDDEDGDVLWCTEMERYCRPPTKNKGLDTFLLGCLDFLITILMWLILVDVDVKDC